MVWCHQATSHYLTQCLPRSASTYGVTRLQWVKILWNCLCYYCIDPIRWQIQVKNLHAMTWVYLKIFRFWRGLYMRYESCVHPRESVFDTVCALKDHSQSMEEHIRLLEKVRLEIKLLSNLLYKLHQIPKLKCFSSRLAVVSARTIEARCSVDNENVAGAAPTGDAPTTCEWSAILLPTMVHLYYRFDSTVESIVLWYGNFTLNYWGLDKMAPISQTTILDAFAWVKIIVFLLIFDWTF